MKKPLFSGIGEVPITELPIWFGLSVLDANMIIHDFGYSVKTESSKYCYHWVSSYRISNGKGELDIYLVDELVTNHSAIHNVVLFYEMSDILFRAHQKLLLKKLRSGFFVLLNVSLQALQNYFHLIVSFSWCLTYIANEYTDSSRWKQLCIREFNHHR